MSQNTRSSRSLRLSLDEEKELFQKILSRFLLNLPYSQRRDQSRLSYHAEKAYYYYLDVILCIDPTSYEAKPEERFQFFCKLAKYCPRRLLSIDPNVFTAKLSENKPTCGAIIMNETESKVIVIRSKYGLGFPKGKWNQSERLEQCAAREVFEEIGVYIHTEIEKAKKIEFFNKENVPSVFFVVKGIKETVSFNIDKKEIADVFWMSVSEVTRSQKSFVARSKIAWKYFLQLQSNSSSPKISFQDFINAYKPNSKQVKEQNRREKQCNANPISEQQNPFFNFKLDTEKLMSVFV